MMTMTHLDIDDIRSIIAHSFDVSEEKVMIDCYMETVGYGMNEHKEPMVRAVVTTYNDKKQKGIKFMMYTVKVKWCNEYSDKADKIDVAFCFVPADSIQEVVDKMEGYYGKNDIEEITISVFSPDSFLEFGERHADMFYDVKATLKEYVVWQQIFRVDM